MLAIGYGKNPFCFGIRNDIRHFEVPVEKPNELFKGQPIGRKMDLAEAAICNLSSAVKVDMRPQRICIIRMMLVSNEWFAVCQKRIEVAERGCDKVPIVALHHLEPVRGSQLKGSDADEIRGWIQHQVTTVRRHVYSVEEVRTSGYAGYYGLQLVAKRLRNSRRSRNRNYSPFASHPERCLEASEFPDGLNVHHVGISVRFGPHVLFVALYKFATSHTQTTDSFRLEDRSSLLISCWEGVHVSFRGYHDYLYSTLRTLVSYSSTPSSKLVWDFGMRRASRTFSAIC